MVVEPAPATAPSAASAQAVSDPTAKAATREIIDATKKKSPREASAGDDVSDAVRKSGGTSPSHADGSPAADPPADAGEIDDADASVMTGTLLPPPTPLDAVLGPVEHRHWVRHRMVQRERIDQIAHRYGVPPARLRQWNGLSADTEKLRRGTRLKVWAERAPPVRDKLAYEVQPGDTWKAVARRHGADTKDLRAYNWPWKNKMTAGNTILVWSDPVVRAWVDATPRDDAGASLEPVARGAVGVGTPNEGRLLNGVKIPEGEGYRLRMAKSSYGTTWAVTRLIAALARFEDVSPYARDLELGSMSVARGGEVGHHKSHQTGRDIDIRLPRREDVPRWWQLKLSRVDWVAVWHLVRALAQEEARVIFLDYQAQKRLYKTAKALGATEEELATFMQYPRGRGASRGLVRHEPGHEQHLHVRWGCGPHEPECTH